MNCRAYFLVTLPERVEKMGGTKVAWEEVRMDNAGANGVEGRRRHVDFSTNASPSVVASLLTARSSQEVRILEQAMYSLSEAGGGGTPKIFEEAREKSGEQVRKLQLVD